MRAELSQRDNCHRHRFPSRNLVFASRKSNLRFHVGVPAPGAIPRTAGTLPPKRPRRAPGAAAGSAGAMPMGRLPVRVTEHNSSGRHDRTYSADPRQWDHRCNSWSWCFECNPPGKSKGWWSGPNDTALLLPGGDLLRRRRLPNSGGSIPRTYMAGDNPLPIRRKRHRADYVCFAVKGEQIATGGGVPHPGRRVIWPPPGGRGCFLEASVILARCSPPTPWQSHHPRR